MTVAEASGISVITLARMAAADTRPEPLTFRFQESG
jgi:hypothetical protein